MLCTHVMIYRVPMIILCTAEWKNSGPRPWFVFVHKAVVFGRFNVFNEMDHCYMSIIILLLYPMYHVRKKIRDITIIYLIKYSDRYFYTELIILLTPSQDLDAIILFSPYYLLCGFREHRQYGFDDIMVSLLRLLYTRCQDFWAEIQYVSI